MSNRQNNLLQIWKKKTKKPLVEINLVSDSDGEQGTNDDTESDYDRMPSALDGETIPEISHEKFVL